MLNKYSIGTGDRFGFQGEAQLKAVQKAQKKLGVSITPVWNKSNREHEIIGTYPENVRIEVEAAISSLNWTEDYFVDADHITLDTVGGYIDSSDFFTLDVSEYIGTPCKEGEKEDFLKKNDEFIGQIEITGIKEKFTVTKDFLLKWTNQYLNAIKEAARLYRYIKARKKSENIVYEISIDEVESPQSPIELFFILKTAADYDIDINTIAPKFTGDFYKGVDYIGDLEQFVKEFDQDLWVVKYAIEKFGLPEDLKLSVHSGSDKFSLYPHINRLIKKHNTGLHLKTAGTTWLEEVIGIAAGGEYGLDLAKSIYEEGYKRREELTAPYLEVINIKEDELPSPSEVKDWNNQEFVERLEHDPSNPKYNSSFRQLLHCAYKIAAERNNEFEIALLKYKESVAHRVINNLLNRHLLPLFSQ